jgi:hypothetical protein
MLKGTAFEKELNLLYHGSPYDFSKFSIKKIGEGEGNQAFGHGIYLTDIVEIAMYYSNTLSDRNGYLYLSKIKNKNFLDWHKSICEKNILNIFNTLQKKGFKEMPFKRKLINGEIVNIYRDTKEALIGFYNSKFLYENLSIMTGSDKCASEILLESGIDGIVYDSNSLSNLTKNKKNGLNYVIFDDSNIEIIDKIKIK